MERTVILFTPDEHIHSADEVHKRILIGTVKTKHHQLKEICHCALFPTLGGAGVSADCEREAIIPSVFVTLIRSFAIFADEIQVGHAINNFTSTCVNKSGVVFLIEVSRVVDYTGCNFRKRSVATTVKVAVMDTCLNLIVFQAARTSLSRREDPRRRIKT